MAISVPGKNLHQAAHKSYRQINIRVVLLNLRLELRVLTEHSVVRGIHGDICLEIRATDHGCGRVSG